MPFIDLHQNCVFEHNCLINFYLIIMVIICKFVNGFG